MAYTYKDGKRQAVYYPKGGSWFYLHPFLFLTPPILQFIVNQKYLLSIYHVPGTVISAKDTLESKTENSFCPQGAEGQWGDTDIK